MGTKASNFQIDTHFTVGFINWYFSTYKKLSAFKKIVIFENVQRVTISHWVAAGV